MTSFSCKCSSCQKIFKDVFNVLRNEHDLSNPCSSRTDDFFFSSYLPYRTLSSERRCLAEVSMEMQSHLFLSFYLKSCHFFLLRGKLRFLQIFISVAQLLPMNVFKLEGFLFFFQNFPRDVFKKNVFPGEEMVTLKLFSFQPAHSQEIAKSSKVMGWFDDSSFFSIFRC